MHFQEMDQKFKIAFLKLTPLTKGVLVFGQIPFYIFLKYLLLFTSLDFSNQNRLKNLHLKILIFVDVIIVLRYVVPPCNIRSSIIGNSVLFYYFFNAFYFS